MNKTTNADHAFKYCDVAVIVLVMLAFAAHMISFKMIDVGPFTIRMGVFVSAFAYILADIITEVYGYARARRMIWVMIGTFTVLLFVFKGAALIPPAHDWDHEAEFDLVFDRDLSRIAGTVVSMFAGYMVNSLVLTQLKLLTDGKMLWMRLMSSSFIAHGVNTILFYAIAQNYVTESQDVLSLIVSSWFLRLAVEIVMLPATYVAINKLKKVEGVDFFDTHTNLNPFRFAIDTKR